MTKKKEPKRAQGIFIVGKMYSGKTTLQQRLLKNGIYRPLSLATSLKKMAADHYNGGNTLSKAEFYPIYNKKTLAWEEKSGRDVLVGLGENIKNFDYSWFYVETALELKNRILSGDFFVGHNKFVIDDNRFEEEYLYFKERFDILLVYLKVPEEVQRSRALSRDGILLRPEQIGSSAEQVDWAEKYADIILINNNDDVEEFLADAEKEINNKLNA